MDKKKNSFKDILQWNDMLIYLMIDNLIFN